MAISDSDKQRYIKRLLRSRMRILSDHGFYGLLLMHMKYSLDESCETAYTDGERIAFSPAFMDSLSDNELDFIMMHEILHIVLKHCFRSREGEDALRENIAADIVVNSNILKENNMDLKSISVAAAGGESMHLAPNGEEGYLYTVEEILEMSPFVIRKRKKGTYRGKRKGKGGGSSSAESDSGMCEEQIEGCVDDHSKWGKLDDAATIDLWNKRIADACEAIRIRDASSGRKTLPLLAQRIWAELTQPKLDWRVILNEFVQIEIMDYSFSPPDRRFSESPFFLPDLNEEGLSDKVNNILFMIDTSGSMADEMITEAYSEVKGAVDQFGGKLCGWLGFFDTSVAAPVPFSDERDIEIIKPYGGGGTDFTSVFSYVKNKMQDDPPVCIIIMTDGYAPFPNERDAMGIPVLWLINNNHITPPWGKIARL